MGSIYTVDETFDHTLFAGSSCCFGVFDGVHTGHRFLIDAAKKAAHDAGSRSIVLTFDRDPDEIFAPDKLKKLLSNEDRLALLAQSGVNAVCVLPFTRTLAALSPQDFLEKTFGVYSPAFLHVGCDFAFGACAQGTVDDLQTWAHQSGTSICAYDLKSADGDIITATRIRGLLADGWVEEANRLLGRAYALHETVRPGRSNGRDFGFRTANLTVAPERFVVAEGVYAGYAIVSGKRYAAAISNGVALTFADSTTANVEVHILDFNQEMYGETIWVEFHHRLRPMMRFSSTQELIDTVMGNIQWVRDNMKV